jgi:hypothetical protein
VAEPTPPLDSHAVNVECKDRRRAASNLSGGGRKERQLHPFFCIAFALSEELQVRELTAICAQAEESAKTAMKRKEELKELLASQEAWFARKEVFKFTRNRHEEKNALNFARATAGLPEYCWLHSFRKCRTLHNESLNATNSTYQLFEMLRAIVQSMRSVDVQRTKSRLRKQLLDSDAMLQAYVSPNWAYMKQAFAQCRGKGFTRAELPYKVMGQFLANTERSKTPAEAELAKKDQLLSN